MTPDMTQPYRIAIVGSGPAGLYAAAALTSSGVPASIDVFEQLPAPYGLLRYGVAPDHPKIKSITAAMSQILSAPGVRFLGNVTYGADVSLQDLRRRYTAIIFATGLPHGSRLAIPGYDLKGNQTATDVVSWYNAHPQQSIVTPPAFRAREVAVVGAGNVALDIVRMLLKTADDLAPTDVPEHVLAAARTSQISDVHLFARRGPLDAKFTHMELRELGKLPCVAVIVSPTDVGGVIETELLSRERRVRSNIAILREWATHEVSSVPRRIHLHFFRRLTRIIGESHVQAIRTVATSEQSRSGSAEQTVNVQAVVHAIGYQSPRLAELPFDPAMLTVPHMDGRVVEAGGHGAQAVSGIYAAGWIKRGPSGVIGTNKADAAATVVSVLVDLPALPPPELPDPSSVIELLQHRGIEYVTWNEWSRLDRHELQLGRAHGRERIKVHDRSVMLDISRRFPS